MEPTGKIRIVILGHDKAGKGQISDSLIGRKIGKYPMANVESVPLNDQAHLTVIDHDNLNYGKMQNFDVFFLAVDLSDIIAAKYANKCCDWIKKCHGKRGLFNTYILCTKPKRCNIGEFKHFPAAVPVYRVSAKYNYLPIWDVATQPVAGTMANVYRGAILNFLYNREAMNGKSMKSRKAGRIHVDTTMENTKERIRKQFEEMFPRRWLVDV